MAKNVDTNRLKKPKRKKPNLLRLGTAALLFLIQAAILVAGLIMTNQPVLTYFIVSELVGIVFVTILVNTERNPSFKLLWTSVILCIPGLGVLLYLMWGRTRKPKSVAKVLPLGAELAVAEAPCCTEKEREANLNTLAEQFPRQEIVSRYLDRAGFPVYRNTPVKYYDIGDKLFPDIMEAVSNAKKFIFLETFILSRGTLWDQLYAILERKAAEGVKVRVLYDDFGSITALPHNFDKRHSKENLEVSVFNRVIPIISYFYVNHRDHQKICVVDGTTGFTGGVNIADEYANLVEAYGEWKDSGVRVEGDAVWSLTVAFLQMWEYSNRNLKRRMAGEREDWLQYAPETSPETLPEAAAGKPGAMAECGFAQPVADGPFKDVPDKPIEFLYMHMINNARKYVYITTPYLILDNEISNALCLAALSGVDVRIITPGIPDKKYVYTVTRYFYGSLLKAGVKIYEYTPGFIHAKNIVSDDETAVVGTVNMDYRSFYLHFENMVWMCGGQAVREIRTDFDETLKQCREISLEEWKRRPFWYKILQGLLRILAPLF